MNGIRIVEKIDGELRVSSEIIAERTENQHASVLRVIRDNLSDFEAFGRVGFEIAPFQTAGGVQRREVAHLNEPQATLLMTFMRNSEIVKAFKVELVKQFYAMRQALNATSAPSGKELLALAVLEAQQVIERKDEQIAALAPRAESWDALADSTGTYTISDAGKVLAGTCDTGPRRIFEQLEAAGWIFRGPGRVWKAYQHRIAKGLLVELASSHRHPGTGVRVLDAPQVRVTPTGMHEIRRMLGAASVLAAFEAVA